MTKYAVILQATHNATEFRTTRGFYHKHLHDLQQAEHEILKIDVNNIAAELDVLPSTSVGFFWVRMHGSPQSMTATEKLDITLQNLDEIFKSLPRILSDNACVFLDSCKTGYFLPDFNNMQFAFARLTLEKPRVKIVAPSQNLNMCYFSIQEDGEFSFEMQAREFINEKNITVELGQETKSILSDAIKQKIPFEAVAEEIKKSLKTSETNPFLDNFQKNHVAALCAASFDLTNALMNIIDNKFDEPQVALEEARELLEIYHASPNFEEGFVLLAFSFHSVSPLASAVYYQHVELVQLLLKHGADPLHSYKGITILDFAKQIDEDKSVFTNWKKQLICSRREKMNAHSKMHDLIMDYLESHNEKEKSVYIRQRLFHSGNSSNRVESPGISSQDEQALQNT